MKSRNLAVGGVVAVLVIALWFMFVLKPTRADTSKVHKQAKEAQRETLGLQAKLAQVSDKARNEQTKRELAVLHAAVPATPQLSSFIRLANTIAAQSGITWQSVTPTEPTRATGGNSIALGIQVQGGYAQVLDYMQRLQDLPRLVIVDNINIGSASETAGQPAGSGGGVFATETGADVGLNLQITARMFVAAPTAPAAAPAGAGTSGSADAAPPAAPAG
jgi:Tfp pilus assembly protein PilO